MIYERTSPLIDAWTPEKMLKTMHDIYSDPRGLGKSWEPPDPGHPIITRAIRDGYLRRADGRCGFEAMKDTFLVWTPAGLAAMKGYQP